MSKYCPIHKRNVVYLDCLECDTKECRDLSGSTLQNTSLPNDKKTKETDENDNE